MDIKGPSSAGFVPFAAALADLRGSLRWLIAASGAAAAVLVAGLQLNSAKAGSPVWLILIGLGAASLAIAAVIVLLVGASRVLTLPRPTATDISNAEIEIGVAYSESGITTNRDPLVEWIQERRTYLLGSAKTVTDLYSGQYMNSLNALRELSEGRSTRWRGQLIKTPGNTKQRQAMEQVIESAQAQLTGVEDAAHYFLTNRKYQQLFGRRFTVVAVVFVLAVLGFALTTTWPAPEVVSITDPLGVRVYVVDKSQTAIPLSCDNSEFLGVQVGGSTEDPVINLPPYGIDCPALTIKSADGLVIVPVVK